MALPRHDEPTDQTDDRAARVAAGRGRYAHLAPGRSMVEEPIAERRAEGAAEDQASRAEHS